MKVEFEKSAQKYIRGQPPKVRTRLLRAIYQLPKGDVRPLIGRDGVFRLRVGEYRIIFSVEACETIIIRNAGPRGDVYK